MKIFKEKLASQVDDVVCDVCGESCKKDYNIENAELNAHWGYESGRDLQKYEIDLCEKCFDKTLEFINSIAVKKIEYQEQL